MLFWVMEVDVVGWHWVLPSSSGGVPAPEDDGDTVSRPVLGPYASSGEAERAMFGAEAVRAVMSS